MGTDPDKFAITDKSELVQLYRKTAIQTAVVKHDKKNAADLKREKAAMTKKSRQELAAEKQKRMMARVAELEAQGESTWSAQWKAMKEMMSDEMSEVNKKKAEMRKNAGEGAGVWRRLSRPLLLTFSFIARCRRR